MGSGTLNGVTQPLSLFVYYTLPSGPPALGLGEAVATMQAGLRSTFPGLCTALYVRPETTPATWMEAYHHPEGVPDALHAAIQASVTGWPSAWQVTRHTESFVLLSSSHSVD